MTRRPGPLNSSSIIRLMSISLVNFLFSKVFCRLAINKHRASPNPHFMGDFRRSFSAFFASCLN